MVRHVAFDVCGKRREALREGDTVSHAYLYRHIRMRDRLAHQALEDMDMSIVWRTALINGPELRHRASRLLAEV